MRGQVQDTGRTWVWHEGDGVVFAYFTLGSHALHRGALSRSRQRSLPREIPAIIIARLALDSSLHGQGLGGELLVDALSRCVQVGHMVASRYVVVDAADAAAATFYERYGFGRIPDTDPVRLLRRLRDIADDLADA